MTQQNPEKQTGTPPVEEASKPTVVEIDGKSVEVDSKMWEKFLETVKAKDQAKTNRAAAKTATEAVVKAHDVEYAAAYKRAGGK